MSEDNPYRKSMLFWEKKATQILTTPTRSNSKTLSPTNSDALLPNAVPVQNNAGKPTATATTQASPTNTSPPTSPVGPSPQSSPPAASSATASPATIPRRRSSRSQKLNGSQAVSKDKEKDREAKDPADKVPVAPPADAPPVKSPSGDKSPGKLRDKHAVSKSSSGSTDSPRSSEIFSPAAHSADSESSKAARVASPERERKERSRSNTAYSSSSDHTGESRTKSEPDLQKLLVPASGMRHSSKSLDSTSRQLIDQKNRDPDPLILGKLKYLEDKVGKLREELDDERSQRRRLLGVMEEYERGFAALTDQARRHIDQIAALLSDVNLLKQRADASDALIVHLSAQQNGTASNRSGSNTARTSTADESLEMNQKDIIATSQGGIGKSTSSASIQLDTPGKSSSPVPPLKASTSKDLSGHITQTSTGGSSPSVPPRDFASKRSKSAKALPVVNLDSAISSPAEKAVNLTTREEYSTGSPKQRPKSEKSKKKHLKDSSLKETPVDAVVKLEKKRLSTQYKSLQANGTLGDSVGDSARSNSSRKMKKRKGSSDKSGEGSGVPEGYDSDAKLLLKSRPRHKSARTRSKDKSTDDLDPSISPKSPQSAPGGLDSVVSPREVSHSHSHSSESHSNVSAVVSSPYSSTASLQPPTSPHKTPAPPKFDLTTGDDPDKAPRLPEKKPRRRTSVNLGDNFRKELETMAKEGKAKEETKSARRNTSKGSSRTKSSNILDRTDDDAVKSAKSTSVLTRDRAHSIQHKEAKDADTSVASKTRTKSAKNLGYTEPRPETKKERDLEPPLWEGVTSPKTRRSPTPVPLRPDSPRDSMSSFSTPTPTATSPSTPTVVVDDLGRSSDSESHESRTSSRSARSRGEKSSLLDPEAIDKKLKGRGLSKREMSETRPPVTIAKLSLLHHRRTNSSVGDPITPRQPIDTMIEHERRSTVAALDMDKIAVEAAKDGEDDGEGQPDSESSQGDEKKTITKKFILIGSNARTFGVPLHHAPLDEMSIPLIVAQLCSHIKHESWIPADIWDKAVEVAKIDALKKRFDTNQNPLKDQDLYVVAALLKRFFFELPDSLFMTSKYKYWIEALDIEDDPVRVPFLRSLVHSLDRVNRKVVYHMFSFFNRLAERDSAVFTPGKFGVAFGPLFLRSKVKESLLNPSTEAEKELEDELHNENAALLLGLLLKYQTSIFPFKLEGLEFYRKNHFVKAATVDNFVILLLDPNYGEKDFHHIFWTTSAYFVEHDELLRRLISLYQLYAGSSRWEHRMRIKLLMTIKLWVRHYSPALGRDEAFQKELKKFSEEALKAAVSDPEQQLINSFHYAPPPERDEEQSLRKRLLALKNVGEGDTMFDSVKHDPKTLATQLSLVGSKLMALIDSSELINGASVDPDRSPTYTALVEFINRVTKWVAFEVVSRHTAVDRARILGYFIEVSKICVSNHDYNMAWAVFGAFGLHQISRLAQTWEKLSRPDTARHKKLSSLFDPRMNFGEYRRALEKSTAEGTAIPILAFLPKDIIRYETDPTYTEDKLVDFEKMRGIYHTMLTLSLCKSQIFTFTRVDEIWDFLLALPGVSETKLDDFSYKVEPKVVKQ